MGFFRDFGRAWHENTSLSEAHARNRLDDFRKEGRPSPRSLMGGMGTPYGRFDVYRQSPGGSASYGEGTDDDE